VNRNYCLRVGIDLRLDETLVLFAFERSEWACVQRPGRQEWTL